VGGKASEAIPKFLAGRPAPWDVARIHTRKKELLAEHLQHAPLRPLPTARLLPILAHALPLAIASSGSRPGVEAILARLEWKLYFRAVITGEDVQNGKPAPDPFLLAARRLGVSPERCLAFEDTEAGILAARAAGMLVIDVRSTNLPSDLQ
jgi:HAD superfamily hydrolase (TIGR01509 family)